MKCARLALGLFFLISTSPAMAEVLMGNGFTCVGNSIMKAGKVVTYTKAKSNLTTTIAKLKTRLETAPKKKKAGLKAQIAAAKAAKAKLSVCSSGNLDLSQVDPLFTQLASGSGIFSGNYSGLVGGFIPISGTVQVVFELEGTVFGATLSLGGNLGSTLDAQPLAFQNDVGGIGFPAQFFLANTFLGDVQLTFTQAGHLTITNPVNTTGLVTFEGDFSNSTITSTLSGSYKGVSFSGGANLTRQS